MGASGSKNTLIVGANGCVGAATIESLLLKHQGVVKCHAGVRDIEKFKSRMLNVPTVHIDMLNKSDMTKKFRSFHCLFVVVPSDANRVAFVSNILRAAKKAGVKYVLMLSVTIANTRTLFGRQFQEIEEQTKSTGIPYTIIRLPLFIENLFSHETSVIEHGLVNDPRDPRRQYAGVSVADVGKCAAEILSNPRIHCSKIYNLVSETYSLIDLSQSMSKVLQRPVRVKEISFDRFKDTMLNNDIPEWQVDGLIEWLELDFDKRIMEHDKRNIERITGSKPTSLNHFLACNADRFGWELRRNPHWSR